MVNVLLILSLVISFVLTYFTIPFWIKMTKKAGLIWEDMNKPGKPKNVAASGGIVVVIAFIIGVFYYIAVRTFIMKDFDSVNLNIFALLSVVLILSMVGVIDDMLGWKNKGLSKRTRILLAFIASIPLVVINAGTSTMNFPFLGQINFGILYPLLDRKSVV